VIGKLASIGRLHIVAIAVAGTFTFGWLFTGRYLWAIAALAGFDWFLVNLLNRVVDTPRIRPTASRAPTSSSATAARFFSPG